MTGKRLFLSLLIVLLTLVSIPVAQAQEEPICESDVIVQEGDWLSTIAERAYGNPMLYQAIAVATNLKARSDSSYATIDNHDVIQPGWKLCLPNQVVVEELEVSAPVDAGVITVEELINATYSGIYDEPVTLTDGVYESGPLFEDSPEQQRVMMISNGARFGDLDGDGMEDAIVFLAENSGGSGQFTYLGAQLNRNGVPTDAGTIWVGDRAPIKSEVIENGQIVLEIITQGPGDALCCATHKARVTYALQDGALAEVGNEDLGKISSEELNGTNWTLIELDTDRPAPAEPAITLTFADGQISGSGGCNNYTGGFSLGGDYISVMSIGPVASTQMACDDDIQSRENAYFAALQNVSQWSYVVGQLAMYYTSGDGSGRLLFIPE
jgi:heat shock protein HslJ